MQPLDVIFVKWGTKYSMHEYVNLKHAVTSNTSHHCTFHLISDDVCDEFIMHPLAQDGRRHMWHKLQVFNQSFGGSKKVYMDVDVNIVGDLDVLFDIDVSSNTIVCPHKPWKPRINAGYMMFENSLGWVEKEFIINCDSNMEKFKYTQHPDLYIGDQNYYHWLQDQGKITLQDVPPHSIVLSRSQTPTDSTVIVHHAKEIA